jgi:hypothetical protein
MGLRFRRGSVWINVCDSDIRVRFGSQWKRIKSTDRVYVNGSWVPFCAALVGNQERKGTFQRTNCPTGFSGGYFEFVVAANSHYAATLAEANALADNDLNTNGPIQANNPANNVPCIPNTTFATAFIDINVDNLLESIMYIDTPGVTESGTVNPANYATAGSNFFEPGTSPQKALILASDLIANPTTKWRYGLNIGELIARYPDDDPVTGIPKFIFKLRGRGAGSGTKSGTFSLKYANQKMIMNGSPGSYIPSIDPPGGPAVSNWSGYAPSGADGNKGVTIGDVIATFEYDRANNTFLKV